MDNFSLNAIKEERSDDDYGNESGDEDDVDDYDDEIFTGDISNDQ